MSVESPGNDPYLFSRARMFVLLGALLFLGFLLATTISYVVSRNSIRRAILDNELPLTSDNIYSEIQRDLFEPILISSLMANDTFVKDWIVSGESDPEPIIRYLGQIQQKYGTITSFLVSEQTRKYYHSASILKTVQEENPVDRWFFRVRGLEKDYEINVDPDMANRDAMTIFINYRVLNRDGEFLGATGVGLTVNAVKSLMQDYQRRYDRDIYFYDLEGNLVLHSLGENSLVKESLPNHIQDAAFRKIVENMKRGEAVGPVSAMGSDGELLNYRFIPELEWMLVVEQKADGTRGIFLHSLLWNFLICLLISVVFLSVIGAVILRYQRNMEAHNRQLAANAQRILEQADELKLANERLDALHREKDEFIGVTVHDLKNPLAGVLGFSRHLLEENHLDSESRESVSHIHAGSLAMWERIESLLKLTELDSATETELLAMDPLAVTAEVLTDMRWACEAKHIRLETNLPATAPKILANRDWMACVLENLLSNAIKYSPFKGTVRVDVCFKNKEMLFSVSDEGEGISDEEQSKLFQKFVRLSPKPTAGEDSSGLGLYIVKRMMERMGGRIQCESRKGAGSTFTAAFCIA